ncbi:unnamed protein product, partial [Ectocarpus sp. 12 AP-2014]
LVYFGRARGRAARSGGGGGSLSSMRAHSIKRLTSYTGLSKVMCMHASKTRLQWELKNPPVAKAVQQNTALQNAGWTALGDASAATSAAVGAGPPPPPPLSC